MLFIVRIGWFETSIRDEWWMEWKQLIMWLQLRLDWLICTFYAALALMLIFLSDNETFSEVSMGHTVWLRLCDQLLAIFLSYFKIILALQSDASAYWFDSFKSIFITWRISILYQCILSCWKSLDFIRTNSWILTIARWNKPQETDRK